MKRKDRLFQKSVESKSRYIPAGYNRRIADTLNSLPDIASDAPKEATVQVIAHKTNYRYIAALSAAALIMITGGAYLYSGLSSGNIPGNTVPETTVKYIVPVTTQLHGNDIVTETYGTCQTTAVTTSVTQDDDETGISEITNKVLNSENVTRTERAKDGNATVIVTKKTEMVQNTEPPEKAEPPVHDATKVTAVPKLEPELAHPDITSPLPGLADNKDDKKEKNEKEDKKDKHQDKKENPGANIPADKPNPPEKLPHEEIPAPGHFSGGNNVGSKRDKLPEPVEIEKKINHNEVETYDKSYADKYEQPEPYMLPSPGCECENENIYLPDR